MNITHLIPRQILDSRGNPTIEVDVWVDNQFAGRAAVPSGASTGSHEAHELRDGGKDYHGLSVQTAVSNVVEQILPAILHKPADDQRLIDQTMIDLDATENKSRLGANAILAVSLAAAHAAAKTKGQLLYQHINELFGGSTMSIPMPMMNVLNGGKHASNSSDFQEFMIVPHSATSYAHAVQIGAEVFYELRQLLSGKHISTAVGDEGGFTDPVTSNKQMLDFLAEAVSNAGYTFGTDLSVALDIAASEFYTAESYHLACESKTLTPGAMISYIEDLVQSYPIVSVEDGLAEDDWQNWQELTRRLPATQLVGDDLLVTNPHRLTQAIDQKAGNAILIKPNQIGTLSETLDCIRIAHQNGWRAIVSHRSGETEDVTIAHIAIGTGAGQIKTGSLSRSERTAKHNEIMRIESIDPNLALRNPFA